LKKYLNIRFFISRVSHLVTRRTVRSFRVKKRTPNFGSGGVILNTKKKNIDFDFYAFISNTLVTDVWLEKKEKCIN
jgi:hypothetical protein